LEALASIRTTFIDRAGHVNAPAFERLEDVLGGMRTMLEGYLGIGDGAAAAAADDSGTATAGGTAAATVTLTGAVTDHASAKAALKAAEDYFQRIEPSSPVL